jgi:hypothetical protein
MTMKVFTTVVLFTTYILVAATGAIADQQVTMEIEGMTCRL